MAESQNWGAPPNMPPPAPASSVPPPAPSFVAPPSAMPPPLPGSGAGSQFGSSAPTRMPVQVHTPNLLPAPMGVYARPDKSLGVAYLLWFFLGFLGVHHFYLGKWQRGLWYLFTFGLLFVGLFVDLFTLPWQVKRVNAERRAGLR